MKRQLTAVLLIGLAGSIAAAGSSFASVRANSPSVTYGPAVARFSVTFPGKPMSGAVAASVLPTVGGTGTGYWYGVSKNPFGAATVSGNYYVVEVELLRTKAVANIEYQSAVKGLTCTKMASVPGSSKAVGMLCTVNGVEVVELGNTVWLVGTNGTISDAATTTFLKSFSVASGDS